MKLFNLLKGITYQSILGNDNVDIDNLTQDTREEFTKNTAYFAVKGTQVDGHNYIDDAIEKGALVIFCETKPDNIADNVSYVVLDSVLDVMGYIVSNFYDNPSHKLKIIAITGTNGKTTVATSLYQSLLLLGEKSALFSTAGDFINGAEFHSDKKASSSMEIIELHKNLRKSLNEGCSYVCLEATSHALDQQRLVGTKIAGAIFTNLTQDHLDYHPDFNHYQNSKKRLFDELENSAFALVNIDDSYGSTMISETQAHIISYGNRAYLNPISRDLTFMVKGFGLTGTEVYFNEILTEVKFVGEFNMYNLIAVYGALLQLGFNMVEIGVALSRIQGARGRMEIVTGEKEGVIGIVDYAHTPDALENVLATLAELPHNKLITLVGVGGDRDRIKRPLMAKIAQKNSDHVLYTSDNPRTENPEQIFSDLLSGCDVQKKNFEKIEDRELAIKKAVELSGTSDIILIAGKGHEDNKIIGIEKIHFDDKEILNKYI